MRKLLSANFARLGKDKVFWITAVAVFISLFLGTEYSDGTIRNKLAVGHRRLDVYLANYMTCFAAGIVLLLAASACYDRLCEPEMSSGAMLTANGIQMMNPEPNPLYVSGTTRTVLECVMEFLPTGQAMLMADNVIVHPVGQIIFSVVFFIITSGAGILAFRRKDLR